ncbi:MAG: hypothetical protein KKE20_05770 [Nanoarchaeota archaeon]|nr:hypothetical protein [Nanoarchaeota archaeon]
MAEKRFFRCNVCADIHYGIAGPAECPTCHAKNAYIEVPEKEARMVMKLG